MTAKTRIEEYLSPDWTALDSDAKLNLIKHIRSDRHFIKPGKVIRETKQKKTRVDKALQKLTPEEKRELLAALRGEK
jgi:hypothetical protein